MESLNSFKKLFQYDYWGNRESLASLTSAFEEAERPLTLISHIIGAQKTWLSRLEPKDASAVEPWPTLTADECRAAIENLHRRWKVYLEKLIPQQLGEYVVYRNTQGVEFRSRIEDVLQQLILHSAYHRGQVAVAIRRAGGKPAVTDYIFYVRQMPQGER